jgi:sugar phosphate isomerase/epimerase
MEAWRWRWTQSISLFTLTIALDADWLWENRVVRHIHVKDFDGCPVDAHGRRRYLHPGEGNIDFHAVAETLKQRAFSGTVSLESSAVDPYGEVDLGRIDRSLSFLSSLASPYAER